jgi:hypothetical protein
MPITNGTIEFAWPASYADNRPGAKVALSFVLEAQDNLGQVLAEVGTLARAEATRLQNGTAAKMNPADVVIGARPTEATPATLPGSSNVVPLTVPVAPTPPASPAPTAMPGAPIVDAAASVSPGDASPLPGAPVTMIPGATAPVPVEPPSTQAPVSPVVPATTAAVEAVVPAATPVPVVVPSGVTELTPAALVEACKAANIRLSTKYGTQAAVMITEVCHRFVPPPGAVQQIPVEHRPLFIDQLNALQ